MTIPFGVTLRRLRIENGLSQKQLADRLHMERSSVSNWEAGRRIPDAVAISQLAKALGVDAADLLAANEESVETPERPFGGRRSHHPRRRPADFAAGPA